MIIDGAKIQTLKFCYKNKVIKVSLNYYDFQSKMAKRKEAGIPLVASEKERARQKENTREKQKLIFDQAVEEASFQVLVYCLFFFFIARSFY